MTICVEKLTEELIRCPSVTPDASAALDIVARELAAAGFQCRRIERAGIDNLHARWGEAAPIFGFNGHVDVVPEGDAASWEYPPFAAVRDGGRIYGRGACDMKSGVAAFVAAAIGFVQTNPPNGSVVLTITGDEEGAGTDGTAAILDWMQEHGERMDVCVVGEPTCPEVMGEMMKIGRRGSMTAYISAQGVAGHSAYPHRAKNPVAAMILLMAKLEQAELDAGNDLFDPSTLAITGFDTGNSANNVIPQSCKAMVNIRFNDQHHSADLCKWLEAEAARIADATGVRFEMEFRVSGESFVTAPGALSELVAQSVAEVTGREPVLSTSGGTSDARFIRAHCPVVEFGLVGSSMHQRDEWVEVAQLHQLRDIYTACLRRFFTA